MIQTLRLPKLARKAAVLFSATLLSLFVFSASASATPLRGLFVSMIENEFPLESRKGIEELISFSKARGIKMLFVQIYRGGQSWFVSDHADAAPYARGMKNVGEDPFALLIREAHREGIKVHAWMNMLSLSDNENAPMLKKYGSEILTQKPGDEKHSLADYKIDNQYFLEPGSSIVRSELAAIVQEVAQAYPDLDGMQFDYIRYPDSNPFYGYTAENINRFKKATRETDISESNSHWKDWRRKQVTDLVVLLLNHVKVINPKLKITTTGCAPYVRALEECFQDWPAWLHHGLVPFVTVMTYPPDVATFEKYLKAFKQKIGSLSQVNVAIGAYKMKEKPAIFEEQFQVCEASGARGCVVFYYGVLKEKNALADFLKLPENPVSRLAGREKKFNSFRKKTAS